MRKTHDIALDALLPYYEIERPLDLLKCFGRKGFLDVEIGSGLGEFILKKAKDEPSRNFVGIEQQWKRARRILQKVKVARKHEEDAFVDNVRVLRIDATVALERLFAPKTINIVYCLFPCPWPKTRHVKYRLFSKEFLLLLNSRLVEKGEVYIVTDSLKYFDWVGEELKKTGFTAKKKTIKPKFGTKFERKWCSQGQKKFFELHLIKKEHVKVPFKKDIELKSYYTERFDPKHFNFANVRGESSIMLKDFLFDPKENKGLVHVLVSEKSISQHAWFMISKGQKRWRLSKAEGCAFLPTPGVAHALDLIFDAVKSSCSTKVKK